MTTAATSCNTPVPAIHTGFVPAKSSVRVSKSQAAQYSGVSELFLTARSPELSVLLLPLLAHLSRDDSRWITWVGPSGANRGLLQEYGVDIRRVRFVATNSGEDQRWMLWEALHAGTSHTVIADGSSLSEDDMLHLEQAAAEGSCRALLIRQQ